MAEFEAIGKALQIPQSVLNNIDKIDQKINLIASDSEKMATHFMSAMTRMGTGADGLLQKLNAIQVVVNRLDLSKFSQSANVVGQGTTQVEQFAASIAKAAEAINKYNTENRKRADVDNSKQIRDLQKEIETLKKRTQQLDEYIAKQREANRGSGGRSGGTSSGINSDVKAMNAYNRAMAASEALVTQRINKIAKLRNAEEQLRATGRNYQMQLQRIQKEIARLNKLNDGQVDAYGRVVRSQRQLVNTSEQLTRQLALVFSVSAIEGYIMKLVQVRGEFELQQTALASILQNKDKADQLFGQITELAVKSPFTLKELTTYTKSLAAYQVQYEDLYDTTKMLADVSAGLGVDMQRLILAFGQVKAANILRGTEVRQFTEAGLNILGELAKYYSELEGRMISVGEVQDMVTRRMVSFGDVEEVFKRVTSSGGIFYDMQERQSQTLAGMMSNLRDNLDLMFNDIGKSNDSVIKDVVKTIADLIKNWREVAWYVEKVAIAFVAYRSVVALAALGNSKFVTTLFNISTMSGTATTKIKALGKTLASLGKGLAVGGIILLLSWLTDLIREATRAQRESERLSASLRELTSMDAGNLNKTISALDDLLARYKLSNEGSQERRDIISALNSNYGEYLNFIVDETTTLEQLTTTYDEVIKRMKERSSLSTLEKGYQEINQLYEEQISEGRKQLEKELSKGLRVKVGSGFTKNLLPTEEDINNIFNLLQQRIRESNEEELKGSREQRNLLQEIVTKYYGDKDLYLSQDYMKTIPLIDAFIQKKEKEAELENNINSAYKQTMKTREANLAMQERELQYEQQKKEIQNAPLSSFETQKQLQEASKQYELDKIDIQLQFGEISEASAKRAKDAIIHWATATTEDINKNLREKLSEFTEEDISRVLVTPEVQYQGVTSLIQETITQYKAQNSIIEQQEQLKEAGLRIDENVLENAKKLLAMYKARGEVLGIDWSSIENKGGEDGGSKNPELDKLKEQLKIIQQVEDAYRKYREYMSKEEASSMAKQLAEGTVAESVVGTLSLDTSELIEGLEQFSKEAFQRAGEAGQKAVDEVTRKYKEKNVIDIEVEGIEEARKRVESIFQSYEFSLELNTKGIDANAFKEMLKAVGATDAEISLMGLNTTTFKEAQQQLRDEIFKLQQEGGTKQLDEAKKIQEQLTALEIKEANKRFDELLKLREKYQTNEEKISDIETDIAGWQSELDKINELGEAGNQTQKELLEYRIQNGKDTILQLRSEALQLTEFWETLFGDLGEISISSIRDIMRQRDEIIANVSPIKNNQGETSGYSSSFIDAKGQKQEVQMTIGQYNQLIKAYQRLKNEYRQRNPLWNFINSLKEGRKEGESFSDYLQRLALDFEALADESFAVADSIMSMTGASSESQQMMQGAKDIVGGTLNTIKGFASGNPLAVIGGLATAIGGIFKIGDAKKEKQIQRQLELVEDLQHAYEKLEEAIDNAYSIDQLEASTKQAQDNLEQQAAALEEAIRLEEDKKKTDKDKLKEYQQQLEDVREQQKQRQEEFITEMGGFGREADVKSAAQEFADAWFEAFNSTGDGLAGLEDTFDDYFNNILKKQIMMKATDAFLKPLLDQINAIFSDSTLGDYIESYAKGTTSSFDGANATIEELDAVREQADKILPLYNEFAKQLMESLGVEPELEGDGDTLTGLQKGIQGLSEQTGQALEALLESIRFFVSDENAVIHNIYNTLVMPTEENPFLAELRVQSEQLRLLYGLWNGVIKNSSGKGRVVRVELV